MKFHQWTLILSCLLWPDLTAEEIHVKMDKEGLPVFSDTRTEGTRRFEIRDITIFSSEEAAPASATPQESDARDPEESPDYNRLDIVSPQHGTTIRENSGRLSLKVAISPDIRRGHRAELVMDGLALRTLSGSGTVLLFDVERGTHVFNLRVVTEDGKVIAQGEDMQLTLLRYAMPGPSS